MNFKQIVEYLIANYNSVELPGLSAQLEMIPPHRIELLKNEIDYIDASVAILLFKKSEDYYFPLIMRTSHNGADRHRGQISLPGGKFEISDGTFEFCAQRELKEELGLYEEDIFCVGHLTPLLIPISNFKVHPFIFVIENKFDYSPQSEEVEYVIEVKIDDLTETKNSKTGEIELYSLHKLNEIPYFDLNNNKIWGATAMILNEFKNVLLNIKQNCSNNVN
jgi:8-oxo-dGTP pyrophosphatase MutT (NUDIX family)